MERADTYTLIAVRYTAAKKGLMGAQMIDGCWLPPGLNASIRCGLHGCYQHCVLLDTPVLGLCVINVMLIGLQNVQISDADPVYSAVRGVVLAKPQELPAERVDMLCQRWAWELFCHLSGHTSSKSCGRTFCCSHMCRLRQTAWSSQVVQLASRLLLMHMLHMFCASSVTATLIDHSWGEACNCASLLRRRPDATFKLSVSPTRSYQQVRARWPGTGPTCEKEEVVGGGAAKAAQEFRHE